MGAYDDLIPAKKAGGGPYDDLIPSTDTLPEVTVTQPRDYASEIPSGAELTQIGRENTPVWTEAPAQALSELVKGMLPHDLESYAAGVFPPLAAFRQGQQLAQGDVSSIPFVGRVPEIMQAEETPAGSKERYLAAMKTLMDVGLLAGAGGERPSPLAAEIKAMPPEVPLAERVMQPRVEPPVPEVPQEPLAPVAPETPPAPEAALPPPTEVAPPPVTPEAATPSLGAGAQAKIKAVMDEYDTGSERVSTARDIAAELDQIEDLPPQLRKAVDDFHEAVQEEQQLYGERGGLEEQHGDALINEAYRATEAPPPPPETAAARSRTADEAQRVIDTMEDKLVAQGADISKLYNPTDKIVTSDPVALKGLEAQGWQPMPPEMVEAYRVRDELGSVEMETSVSDMVSKLKGDTGLPDVEIASVLEQYAITPGKTDVIAQYMASEHAVKLAQESPEAQAESVAYKLAAERGEMFDELRDISPKTLRDAANAVQSVREYFGLVESRAPKLQQPSGAGPPPVQLSEAEVNGQILERRQGILDRKKELEARAANGEQGLEPLQAAVDAELMGPGNPVVHPPPKTQAVPPEASVQASVASEPPPDYTLEAAAARAAQPEVTSTKNVVTAAEREARGLPPAEEAAARDFGTVWDESAKDTAAPARLVAALKVEPRALSDIENAHLLRRQIELQTEHDAMTKAVNEAADPAVAAEAKQRLETVRNDLQDVYDVGKAAGTETGRGLNARKMLADQDYALANMEATTRALVNDGKPLSPTQLSEVAKLHERIRTAEDKLAAYESQDIFNQSLRAQPRRPVLSFLDEQAVKARERIKARKNRLYADPLGVTQVAHLADEAIIGASHIARGVTKFADWSAQMVTEFGDRIKPYLAALFEKSKQQFKAASAGLKKAPVSYAEREARALAGEKKGIITRTKKLIGRAEVVEAGHPFGEFEPLRRRAPRMDPEKARLQFEYQKAKEAFDRGIYESELKKRSVPERILGTAREFLNLPRSLLASVDFSAVRRQGGLYTMLHPFKVRHAIRAMFEATKSEQGYFKVMQEIKDRPNAPEYLRYGLELTDIGPVTRAKMEEQFQSRWAEKIPGVSHSQRAYTGFLNRARADWFDLLKDSLAEKGKSLTPQQGKAIANAVNVFTGRGAVSGKWLSALTALNDVFFAPRWRMSRFQTLIGQPLWKNSGARGVIAKEYAKALIGYGSILTLIGWATKNTLHPMEKNPVSTEAGKLRIGNTRVDFMQGLQQPTVFMSRLLSGRTKTGTGEIKKIYGDVPYGQTTASDVITRFLRSSLAPVPGAVWNVLEQKNVVGEPVTLPSTVRDLTIPLLGQDIYDAMKQQGVPTATALGLVALFGDSIQTYSPRVSTKEPKREPTISQRIKARHAKETRERKKALQGTP